MQRKPRSLWRRWAICAFVVIGFGVMLIFAMPARAQADATSGTFQIALAGRISSSQKGTNAQGTPTVVASEEVHTDQGQYPAVSLQLDITETQTGGDRNPLTGTATLSDLAGQTALFTAQAAGYVDANGVAHSHLAQVQTAVGSGGKLIWNSTLQASALGDIVGSATGTLVFPAGISATLSTSIWPGAITAASVDPTLWYVTRGAGAAAYLLLTVTTAMGMGISTKAFDSVSRRRTVLDLHQVLTLLMVGFIVLHLITLALDPFLSFSVAQLAWPFGETYKPLWVAMGVIGLYALVVVTGSSWLRRFIAYRAWRALHYISALAFVVLTLHGVLAGTDSATPWMLGIYVASALTIGALTGLRVVQTMTGQRAKQATQTGR